MKTVLTENWILDGAKYLFSTEKFRFVEKPKLFTKRSNLHDVAKAPAHPPLPMPPINGGCAGNRGAEIAARGFRGRSQKPRDTRRSVSARDDGHNLHAATYPAVTNATQGQRALGAPREEEQGLAQWHGAKGVRTSQQAPRRRVSPVRSP